MAPVEQQPAPAVVGGGMRDVPLGTLIFRAGLLAEEQLEDALQEGMRTGKRLGEVLAERGLIRDSDLGRLLAGQQGLPFVEVATVAVDPEALRMLPDNIARIQNALAFAVEDGAPVVAVADPTNELVIENVRRALGTEPRLVVAAHGDLARKINEVYPTSAPVAQLAEASPTSVTAAAPMPAPEVSPAPDPAPAPAPDPVLPPAAELPAQAEQPAPAPIPAPMPTVMPPAEERTSEPQPLVAAGPVEIPPLHAQAAEQPPLPPEPPAALAPVVEQALIQPVEVAPEEQPAEPVIVVADPEATVTTAPTDGGLFAQAAEQALAPVEPQQAEPAPEPASPEPALTQPDPQHEHPAQANGTATEAGVVPTHFVILRLAQDEPVELGGLASQDEAENFARNVVGRIGRAEEQGEWPSFGGRLLRPQTIVSVDVVEEAPPEWGGSATRTRWAQPSA